MENGRILLCFPESGKSLESLNTLESLENGLFLKDPSFKDPFFQSRSLLPRLRNVHFVLVLTGSLEDLSN